MVKAAPGTPSPGTLPALARSAGRPRGVDETPTGVEGGSPARVDSISLLSPCGAAPYSFANLRSRGTVKPR